MPPGIGTGAGIGTGIGTGTSIGTGTAAAAVPVATWKRLNVNVANDVADAITTLQSKHGWTISDVIRRAISTYKFIDDETERGSKILIERDGAIREVRFVY